MPIDGPSESGHDRVMVKRFELCALLLVSMACTRTRPITVDASVDSANDRNPITDGAVDAAEEGRLTDAQENDGPIPCAQAVTIPIAAELGLADPESWRVVTLERSVDGRVLGLLQNDASGVRYLVHWQVTEDVAAPLALMSSLNLDEYWPEQFPDIATINDQIHIGADSVYLGLTGDYTEGGVFVNLMIRFRGEPLFCWACGATAEVLEVSYRGAGVDFMAGVPGRDTLYFGSQSFGGFGVYTDGATGLLPSSDFVSVNAMDVFAGLGFSPEDLVAVVSYGRLQVYSGFALGQVNGESAERWNEFFGARTEFVGDVQWRNRNELFFAERGEAQPIRRLVRGETQAAIDPQPTFSRTALEQGVDTSFTRSGNYVHLTDNVFAIHNVGGQYQILSFYNEFGNRGWQGLDQGVHRGHPLSIDAISRPQEMVLISGLPGVIRAVPTTCP